METWRRLLQIAILTPSPHNVQPWRVRLLNEREALLLIDVRRTLPKEDLTGSFIISTMGMFIEALKLLAGNTGLGLEYELCHEPGWYAPAILEPEGREMLPFARLRLVPDPEGPKYLDERLFLKRRTSRLSLLPEKVPENSAQALRQLSAEWGERYEQVTERAIIERILARNTEALFEDLNTRAYHDEIVEWFRFTARAARRTRDGLDYRCMNSSRSTFWTVARFPGLLQFPLTRPLLAKVYRSQLGVVPTLGILAGEFWRPEGAIKAGRFLMRFWLETARLGLYIHPYGNLVTNRGAARWCRTETGIEDIWLVFKIGYSPEPPRSYRRALEEILID
jgi:nitroreductase